MAWTAREVAMLREMGVALPTQADAQTRASAAPVTPAAPAAPAPSVALPAVSSAVSSVSGAQVQVLDWMALQEAVSACQACDLSRTRRKTVFGTGHPQAHWMIVGEAPGEQEDLRGEPFVGAAGQLLDNMLRAVGLTREAAAPDQQVFITNTLKCRPPQNRNPQPQELAQCDAYLRRQIDLVKPRLLLAMGRFAVQQLLGSTEALGKLRGRVHAFEGIPVVVTYHPAYLLRNPVDKAKAWDDLCLALQTMQTRGRPLAQSA